MGSRVSQVIDERYSQFPGSCAPVGAFSDLELCAITVDLQKGMNEGSRPSEARRNARWVGIRDKMNGGRFRNDSESALQSVTSTPRLMAATVPSLA